MVGGAGCELSYVRGEEHAGDVRVVRGEFADGYEGRDVSVLEHAPDKHAAGVVAGAEHGAVAGDGDGGHRDVVFGDELVTASVLAEVPDAHFAAAVAAYEFALVGMDHDVVDRRAVSVVPLHTAAPRIPDLDSAVFRARHHPLALTVEGHARDIVRVALEGQHRGGVRRFNVVELDGVVASGSEVPLVGGDAQAVYLAVGMGDGA